MNLNKNTILVAAKCFAILLTATVFCSADTDTYLLEGSGSYVPYGDKPSSFELKVVYERESSEESRTAEPQSSIAAIRTVGKIVLDFGRVDQTYPFYVTQFPDGGNSLVGFYITNGYPHVLQFQAWSEDKNFYLYESYRKTGAVMRGTAKLKQI